NLSCERRRLARALEALTASRRPRQGITLAVGDGHDRVVERRVDVSDTVRDVLLNLLARALRRIVWSFCHYQFLCVYAVPGRTITSSAIERPCADPCGCVHWSWCADRASADPCGDGRHGSSPDPSGA